MKKPENFNAGATKKSVTTDDLSTAISGNFSSQATKAVATPVQTVVQPVVSPVQIQTQTVHNDEVSSIISNKVSTEKNSRREVKEKFLVSMSKGERSIFKSFCALNNVSMNHFVMCAMDYFKEDMEAGKVTISSHSYKRKEN